MTLFSIKKITVMVFFILFNPLNKNKNIIAAENIDKKISSKTFTKISKNYTKKSSIIQINKKINYIKKYQKLKKIRLVPKNLNEKMRFRNGLFLLNIAKEEYIEESKSLYRKSLKITNPSLLTKSLFYEDQGCLFFNREFCLDNFDRQFKLEKSVRQKNILPINFSQFKERPILKAKHFINFDKILPFFKQIEKYNLSDEAKAREIITKWHQIDSDQTESNKFNFYKVLDLNNNVQKIKKYKIKFNFSLKRIDQVEKNDKKIRVKRFSWQKIRLKIPTKRQLRDACVDAITEVFKFKRWFYDNVQRPFTKYVRLKTGNLIFKDPHINPFIKKYGFEELEQKTEIATIKSESKESPIYRLKTYNRLVFDEIKDFSKIQRLGQCEQNGNIILPQKFFKKHLIKLDDNYISEDFKKFKNQNLSKIDYPTPKKDQFYFITKYFKKSRRKLRGLNYVEVLIPQSYKWEEKESSKNKDEKELFQSILNYDKNWLTKRNTILKTSFRYKPFYHRIAKKLFDKVKFEPQINQKQSLPNFFIGPQLHKSKNKTINSCGYGLSYLKNNDQKIYMNPSTGLISYYTNSKNEKFYGDDSTTAYGILEGRGYYTDKKGIKYFYKENYEQLCSFSKYVGNQISPNGFPKMRNNPYYYKREFYFDQQYPQIKKMAGLWKDLRANKRDDNSYLFNLKKK